MFAQKELIERRARGKRTIECPKPPDYADVEVAALLDGLEPARLPEWGREPAELDAPFAVAVSFPGEHRGFVLAVVERLAGSLGRDRSSTTSGTRPGCSAAAVT